MTYKLTDFDALTATHIPLTERMLDRLADMLYASDEILDMITMDPRIPASTTMEVEDCVRGVYNQINDLMKKLAD